MDDKSIHKEFSAFGLALKRDAMIYVRNFINKSEEPEKTLQLILQRLPAVSQDVLITKPAIEEVVKSLKKSTSPQHNVFAVQSAFDMPKLLFDHSERNCITSKKPDSILGEFQHKLNVYRERYQIINSCLVQVPIFHASTVSFNLKSNESRSITQIGSLISIDEETVVLLGYLDSDGSTITLEDPTGIVPIETESLKPASGIFSVGCIVLLQADIQDKTVYGTLIGHIPAQTATKFYETYWKVSTDPFGWGITKDSAKEMQDLLLTEHKNSLIAVFSDVWVDVPSVVDNFNYALSQFDKDPPNVIVICGSFTSRPFAFDQFDQFTKLFSKFCEIIQMHKTIYENTKIIIIPSINDLGSTNVYPRLPFPEFLQAKLPKGHFMSNPCRIRFLNQTITIFRDDLLKRMLNAAALRVPEVDVCKNLLTTIIDQRHLCPVDLEHAQISWPNDHSMRLFPPPDVLVLCDACQPWIENYADCHAFNPGQFGCNGTYVQYFPADEKAEIVTLQ